MNTLMVGFSSALALNHIPVYYLGMEFFDTLTIDSPRRTQDGYLVAKVRAARTGIQDYLGAEVGRPDLTIVKVYRPPEEVFKRSAMDSFTSIPITNNHPPVAVTADNWKQYAVGNTGEDWARDGEFMRVPLIVKDASAIRAIESGKLELSCGYSCDLKWEPGVNPAGLHYDAIQTNLRGNHIAIVDRARGGPDLRIGDDMPDLKKITVDGIPVETTDAGAQVIETLQGRIAAYDAKVKDADTKFQADLSAKDAKIATLDAEVATLKAAVVTDADLDKRVQDRQKLIADAKRIGGDKLDVTGANADIKKRAVLVKLGDSFKDRDAVFFDAAFELQLVAAPQSGPGVRDTLRAMDSTSANPDGDKMVRDAHAEMVAKLTNPKKQAA